MTIIHRPEILRKIRIVTGVTHHCNDVTVRSRLNSCPDICTESDHLPTSLLTCSNYPSDFQFVANQSLSGCWFEPLWKILISQLGWLFPNIWKIKNVPNHQPALVSMWCWHSWYKVYPKSIGWSSYSDLNRKKYHYCWYLVAHPT